MRLAWSSSWSLTRFVTATYAVYEWKDYVVIKIQYIQ
jgi:hypothetical protein